jgi:hypothetical protein
MLEICKKCGCHCQPEEARPTKVHVASVEILADRAKAQAEKQKTDEPDEEQLKPGDEPTLKEVIAKADLKKQKAKPVETSRSVCFVDGRPHQRLRDSTLDEARVSPESLSRQGFSTCRKCGVACIHGTSNNAACCPVDFGGHEFLSQGTDFQVTKAANETNDRVCRNCGCLYNVEVAKGKKRCANNTDHIPGESYVLTVEGIKPEDGAPGAEPR